MYKRTSDNLQYRERHKALDDKVNHSKADFNKKILDIGSEQQALGAEKQDIEAWLQKVKYDEKRMLAGMAWSRAPLSMNTRLKWQNERKTRVTRLKEIEKRLGVLKFEKQKYSYDNHNVLAYPEVFLRCAKAVLPDEILERINRATIAMLAEMDRADE